MKKKITLVAMFLACATIGFSQASLPTSYDFNNFVSAANLPAGWTTNISGTFTYQTGQAGTAGRLDLQGEYVQIFTQNAMGTTTFYLKGWIGGTATSWTGTFKVQESTNGTSWTDLSSYTTLSSSTYQQYTVNPAAASRYLRFYFSTKNSGCNVGLDEVSMIAAPVTAQEINVKQNGQTIFSGGTSQLFSSAVGVAANETFVVENQGTVNTLNMSTATITGTAAADYTITSPSFPSTVAPSSTQNLVISFNPSASGTRAAVLTINSDDADESAYVINLYGVGGTLASEPASQATSLTFPLVKSYRVSFAFTGNGSDGYLVLRKTSASAITDVPVDGTTYVNGDAVGTSKVVYSGAATGAILNYVQSSTQYQLAVFAYNGSGIYINYNTTSPLPGAVTTSGSMMSSNEYNGISTSASTFLTDLSAHINTHFSTYYSNYDETMIKLFVARDTTAGQKVVTCVYSGENYVYTEPLAWGYMSREHSYCHNWMPTNPADGTGSAPNNVERPEYNDQHHLFPTNQNQVNAQRSNYPMGEVVTQQGTYLNCKWGLDVNGNKVFEPRDEHKGDFARAVFYMATCYNGVNDAFGTPQNWKFRNPISGSIAYGQDQNVLKRWHYQDPPSEWEIARNDFLDSLQGNRNPFIDSVQFVCFIDFSNMTKIATPLLPCNTVGIQEKYNVNFDYSIFPNPAAGEFSILLNANENNKYTLRISDLTGRLAHTQQLQVNNGMNYFAFDKLNLKSGVYMMEIINGNSSLTKKLVIE